MKNIDTLSRIIAEKDNITISLATKIITDLFETISDSIIVENEAVRIKNFGTFMYGKVAGRVTKHPRTKKLTVVKEGLTMRLKIATKIKKRIAEESNK